MAGREFSVQLGQEQILLAADEHERTQGGGRLRAIIDGRPFACTYQRLEEGRLLLRGDFGRRIVHLSPDRGGLHLAAEGVSAFVRPAGRRATAGPAGRASPEVCPPMPAVVIQILVAAGERVTRGQGLVVVSAMKMETTLAAPFDGTVAQLRVAEGDRVGPDDVLVRVEPDQMEGEDDG